MQNVAVLAGGLLVVTGAFLFRKAHAAIQLHDRARSWPRVEGVVVRSELREDSDGDGVSCRALITCTYALGGAQHTTSRHTEGMTFAQPEQSARALASAFPVGKVVEICIDPSDEGAGVLDTGRPVHMVVLRRIGVAAASAGVTLCLVGIVRSP